MWQSLLTFWFTLITLLGPGVCCCAVASAKPVESTHLAKPLKSCCDRAPTSEGAPPLHKPEPAKKCPCERVKHEATALTVEFVIGDSDGSVPILHSPFDRGLTAVRLPQPLYDASPSVPPPSGRDLLALYSILRC